jgi:hypothetical protein
VTHPIDGGGHVWLERSGEPLPLDQIVLERFAAAAAIQRDLQTSALPRLGDPALVELIVDDAAGAADRARALHLVGLRPESPVRVLAVTGPDPGAAVAGLAAFGHAPVDGGYAVLVRGGTPADSIRPPHRSRIGIGSTERADEAWRSWRRARVAVRFADASATDVRLHGASSPRCTPSACTTRSATPPPRCTCTTAPWWPGWSGPRTSWASPSAHPGAAPGSCSR